MAKNVMYFEEIDKTQLLAVGGKGANLGEMIQAGFPVPAGFCITTSAYNTLIQTSSEMKGLFDLLDQVGSDDLEQIHAIGHRIRKHLKSLLIPKEIQWDILEAWGRTGKEKAYAIRSSATAEDLPTASFAGQQDTYLNVVGQEHVLQAVKSCWASLFTDRAIAYRAKNGFSHRSVLLSVVIQQMIFPEVSGIMFTADPVTGRRKTVIIDASFGLGEAIVSGLVSADLYHVRMGEIIKRQVSTKKMAVFPSPDGGTVKKDLSPEVQEAQALPDGKIIELAILGEKIEAHYGSEQDIEWCLSDGKFYVVQSRPITSLYPLPHMSDNRLHVLISFGHVQMMTDAMKPLTLSIWKTFLSLVRDMAVDAGSRLYVNPTRALALKPARKVLPRFMGFAIDKFIAAAIIEITSREDFKHSWDHSRSLPLMFIIKAALILIQVLCKSLFNVFIRDPAKGREAIIFKMFQLWKMDEKYILNVSGPERIRRIQNNSRKVLRIIFTSALPALLPAVLSIRLIEGMLKKQLGDQQGAVLAGQLFKSLPDSITTELGLAVGDLAETVRQNPELADYLHEAKDETFYDGMTQIDGGLQLQQELEQFMARFGRRCSGEIEISSPRWEESSTLLVPLILNHISSTAPGEHWKKFKEGEKDADQATMQAISSVRKSLFGSFKAILLARIIRVYRNYMGLREYPKHIVALRLYTYKKCILEEGKDLVSREILQNEQDVYCLSLDELLAIEEGQFSGNVQELVIARKKQYEQDIKLSPPRIMTSEGEVLTGRYLDVEAPEGALIGTPVSTGVIEGVARVILKLEDANLSHGEILVAPYTDPGWTPLFSLAKGLITEVGGMMTHGSVVAREYGIPAVVGVEKATQFIKDGSYIRVDGTKGYIEILKE